MMTEIWLVRHGETEWSLSGQHTGRTDIPLTDNGGTQARGLRQTLAAFKPAQVFTSPLTRAKETCRLAGFGDVAQIETDLLEWDYGVYEGRTTAAIREEQPDWSLWSQPVPQGESLAEVQARARRFVAKLLTLNGPILAFAHAHILRCVIGVWMDDRAALGEHLSLEPASISVLSMHNGARILARMNQHAP